MTNYYEILGCEKGASYEELKRSYHEKIRKFHPDKRGDNDGLEEFRREFLTLDKAWKTLRDADSRREYDSIIFKRELDDGPVYCQVDLTEMTHEPETENYEYPCRCGGVYLVNRGQLADCVKVRVPCDECTFHIVVVDASSKK